MLSFESLCLEMFFNVSRLASEKHQVLNDVPALKSSCQGAGGDTDGTDTTQKEIVSRFTIYEK